MDQRELLTVATETDQAVDAPTNDPLDEGVGGEVSAEPTEVPTRRDRMIVAISFVLASIPLLGSVALAIQRQEWMAGDRSIMGLFAHDVFSTNPPLLGTISTLGNYTEGAAEVHHLGPAQFYALALPNWAAGGHPAGLLIGGLVVNLLAIVTVVRFANRRLGALGAAGIALTCVGLAYGLGPSLLRDIWTPYLGLWPYLALLVLAWSLLEGDAKALPWAAGFASFLAQIELLFIGPTFVVALVGTAGLFWHRRRVKRQGEGDELERLRRPVVLATVVSLIIWLPVLVQEVQGKPGNLTLLWESLSGQSERAGWTFVWQNLVAQVQLPPIWLRRVTLPFEVGVNLSTWAIASAVAMTVLLGILTVRAVRRWNEQPTVAAILVTCWAALVGGAVNLAILPEAAEIGLQYRRWMWPTGAFIWFALAVTAYTMVTEREPRSPEAATTAAASRAQIPVTLLWLAAIATVPALLGQHTPPPEDLITNQAVESAWPSLDRRLDDEQTYVDFQGGNGSAFAVGPEIVRRIVVRGQEVAVNELFRDSFGDHRVVDPDDPPSQAISIVSDEFSLAPPTSPEAVLAAGLRNGTSSEAFVTQVEPVLERVRGSGGFEPDLEGRAVLAAEWGDGGPNNAQILEDVLADGTRGMFDRRILELQLDGHMVSSPLSDDVAQWMLDNLREAKVVVYRIPAPGGAATEDAAG